MVNELLTILWLILILLLLILAARDLFPIIARQMRRMKREDEIDEFLSDLD